MATMHVPESVDRVLRVPANGIDFEVYETGAGEKLALCLHGFPEHARSWRRQMRPLAELGYRVWAPNLRGYGGTTTPASVDAYAIETLLADVGALIDASGATSVTLLAHDWGAVIAWLFATRKIRPLEKLVIMNVPHPAVFRERMTPRQLAKSWYVFFFQLPELPEKLFTADDAARVTRAVVGTTTHRENYSSEDKETLRANALRPGGMTGMVNYYRALLRGGGSSRQAKLGYPTIATPTLMVWGEDDLALTRETTLGTDRYVADLTMRYLPGISHWVQQDAPDEVNAMLAAFLTGAAVPQYADLVAH